MITLNLAYRSVTDAQLNRINNLLANKLIWDCAFSGAEIEINEFADFTDIDSDGEISVYDATILLRQVHEIQADEDLSND